MNSRQQQRELTKERILSAAIEVFTQKGFHGASTRDIANRADINQGLITYHFSNKDALWRAAADRLFTMLDTRLRQRLADLQSSEPSLFARESIREYVRFAGEHPEFFRLMVDEGKIADGRMEWLVDTHIKPRFKMVASHLGKLTQLDDAMMPHAFYALAGAASLIFAVGPECERLTGLNPRSSQAIEAHADFIVNLISSSTLA